MSYSSLTLPLPLSLSSPTAVGDDKAGSGFGAGPGEGRDRRRRTARAGKNGGRYNKIGGRALRGVMNKVKIMLVSVLLWLVALPAARLSAQEHYTFGTVLDGDTVPLYYLKPVNIYASGMLLSDKEIRNNKKLIRNVRLMRPYALEGKRRLDALEIEIGALPPKERKAAIKKAEEDLLAEYKDEISKYTFSQGLVLIKLIDRETSRSAYAIVGELRGKVRAGLYQTLAKLFGFNLKAKFDPKNDPKDNLIDRICISIDRGQI